MKPALENKAAWRSYKQVYPSDLLLEREGVFQIARDCVYFKI
jgi:hypothetical protein